MDSLRLFVRYSLKRSTVLRALGVATVITPVLILVNQWDRIVGGALQGDFLIKTCLTFCVPYLVSTYSSARAESSRHVAEQRAADRERRQ
jgi:hypothetical protein